MSMTKEDKKEPTLKDTIFSQKERKRYPLNMNGWPDEVFVLELTPAEVEKYDNKLNDVPGLPENKKITWYTRIAYWLAIALVDTSGCRIFNPDDPQAILELKSKIPLGEMHRVERRIVEINGLGVSGEESVKNS